MSYPITTTLARIKAAHPCTEGWGRALAAANKTEADDEPILFSEIVSAVGIRDALWCCRAEPRYSREWRLFAVWCARRVQHLTTDQRSMDALDVAERHANGLATDEELAAAREAAWQAAWAAARTAARVAAGEAAGEAAWQAAWEAARAAARAAAREAAGEAQSQAFAQLCTDGTLPTS